MSSNKDEEWNRSYLRKENHIFFPKEEVVKFLSRFIRKRTGFDSYETVASYSDRGKALDLGCGIGRQTILLNEFGLDAYGLDISHVALEQARSLARAFGYTLDKNFILIDKNIIPFEDNFFDIAISDSVLDSMPFSFAQQYMSELNRTVSGLLYLSLIASDSADTKEAGDTIVQTTHEAGTVQGYYSEARINELIKDTEFSIVQLNKNITNNLLTGEENARFHIVLKKERA